MCRLNVASPMAFRDLELLADEGIAERIPGGELVGNVVVTASYGIIGRWREDAIALIDSLKGPVIPVGSSMGGWVALLATLARPERIKGLVLVNPAQDFTERLMWPGLADHERQAILRDGETTVIEDGLGAYVLTRAMFEEARRWMLLDGPIDITAPTHILQGRADDVVPWRHQIELIERLRGGDVRLDLIEGGDHRLSTPNDLDRLIAAVEGMRA